VAYRFFLRNIFIEFTISKRNELKTLMLIWAALLGTIVAGSMVFPMLE